MKRSRWDNGMPLLASGLMIVLAILNFKLPARYHSMTETTITLADNPFAKALAVVEILAWLGCLVATVFASFRKSWWGLLTSFLFVSLPIVYLVLTADDFEYRVGSSVVDRSGTTYAFLMPGPDQSDSYIGKEIERSGIHVTYEKLVLGDLDTMDGSIWLVRPKNAPKAPKLYLTANNLLVGNNNRSMATCVYDLNQHVGYHFDELNQMSPFLLLTKDDVPSEEDFQNCKGANDLVEKSLVKDLNHPNARVRDMAQELINDIRKASKSKD